MYDDLVLFCVQTVEKNAMAAKSWRKSLDALWAKHESEWEEWGGRPSKAKDMPPPRPDDVADQDVVEGATAMELETREEGYESEATLEELERRDRAEQWVTLRKYPTNVLETCDPAVVLEALKDDINVKERTCDR